ncbi:MAG TPA: fimbria/pilus periplasmic chaperone [Terracidiphilus sp.]
MAQSLSVLPVNIFLTPGQNATSLTVTNRGDKETAIQIRAYAWGQKGDDDQLTPTTEVVVSPPLASIPAGATQVVRLILRQAPQGREATYRILIDQIPPPAEPGVVHVVLRLSIPIFAQPPTRATADVQFHLERDGEKYFLVGINDGMHHEAFRDMVLTSADGRQLKAGSGVSPYILSGVTRRWPIAMEGTPPQPGESLKLSARGDAGAIERQVSFAAGP